jgi:hypothetical protein
VRLELSDITVREGKGMTDDIQASTAASEEINSMFASRTDYVIDAWGKTRDPR